MDAHSKEHAEADLPRHAAAVEARFQEQAGSRYWRDPAVWLLVLGAFLFRLIYNLVLHPDGHPISTFVIDEHEYFSAAHVMAEGRGFSFYDTFVWVRPSLYVVLLSGILRLVGNSYTYLPVLLVQSALSALSLLPLGRLADRVRGIWAARWTVGLGVVFLPFTLFAGLLLSETLFILLFAFALLALLKWREAIMAGSRHTYTWLIICGVLLGAAALSRSTALVFLPLVALWLVLSLPKHIEWRRRVLLAGLFLVVGLATILPVTVRNYAAYHHFILIDTTGAYNLLLASQGVKDEERIRTELEAIPDQGERQSHALSLAWENIRRDPLAFVGKGLKESLDLWQPLLSAEENSTAGYPSGRVPAWHLLSLLVLDTLLYIAILLLAVMGLALAPPGPYKWLTGGWVLLWVVISFVFFAVTRFRLPVVAALLPWAGAGAASVRNMRFQMPRLSRTVQITATLAILAILLVIGADVPLGDTLHGVQSWGAQAPYRQAEQLLSEGKVDDAINSYKEADIEIADTRYGLASAYLMKGDTTLALATLHANEPTDRYEPPIIRGQAARMQGDLSTARSFFNARVVQVNGDDALQWAWGHISPAFAVSIDIGSGLDVGYVRGFYNPEKDDSGATYRWSTGEAEVRDIANSTNAEAFALCVSLSGWRPAGVAPAFFTRGSGESASLQNQPGAQQGTGNLPLSASKDWEQIALSPLSKGTAGNALTTNSFISSGADPRLLGVRVSKVESCSP